MKIICIGRNYADHARELGNAVPEEPVLFIKPETALNTSNSFTYPKFSKEVHFELELVLRMSKSGKNIPAEKASEFYDAIGLGIDFTARDLQSQLKSKGLPWEKAKAFDGSAMVSEFVEISSLRDLNEIRFELRQNGQIKQQGNSRHMLFGFDEIIAHASTYFTLEKGDLIFTGTPEGVGKIEKGDVLTAVLEGKEMLQIRVN